jgi:putative membrane protein
MNNNVKQAVYQHPVIFARLIVRSATATLVMVLLALGISVPPASAAPAASPADQAFLLAAAQINLTEIKLGGVALQNGQRQDVKDFGRRMMNEHMAINDDLKTLAAQENVVLPDTLDATHQRMVDKLTTLNGADFDQAYIGDMYKGHKKAVKAFKAESAATNDAGIKSFADKTLPMLEEHLKLITAMKS